MKKTASYYHEQGKDFLAFLDDQEKTSSALHTLGGAVVGGGLGFLSGHKNKETRVHRAMLGAALGGGAGALGSHFLGKDAVGGGGHIVPDTSQYLEDTRKSLAAAEAKTRAELAPLSQEFDEALASHEAQPKSMSARLKSLVSPPKETLKAKHKRVGWAGLETTEHTEILKSSRSNWDANKINTAHPETTAELVKHIHKNDKAGFNAHMKPLIDRATTAGHENVVNNHEFRKALLFEYGFATRSASAMVKPGTSGSTGIGITHLTSHHNRMQQYGLIA